MSSVRPLLLGFAIPWLGGCGTLLNQSPPGSMFNSDGSRKSQRPFGGIWSDLETLGNTYKEAFRGEKTPRQTATMILFCPLMVAVDLPLSTIGDTILLPWDAKATILRLRGNQEKPNAIPQNEVQEFKTLSVGAKSAEVAPMPREITTPRIGMAKDSVEELLGEKPILFALRYTFGSKLDCWYSNYFIRYDITRKVTYIRMRTPSEQWPTQWKTPDAIPQWP